MHAAHGKHGDLLTTSFVPSYCSKPSRSSSARNHTDRSEGPFTSDDSFSVVGGPDMSLSDQAGDKMGRDDASLRVGSEEDGISTAQVVDPRRVRQICFIQSEWLSSATEASVVGRIPHLSTR